MKRRKAKTVQFTAPTFVEASDYDYSSDEEDGLMPEPLYGNGNQNQHEDAKSAEDKSSSGTDIATTVVEVARAETPDLASPGKDIKAPAEEPLSSPTLVDKTGMLLHSFQPVVAVLTFSQKQHRSNHPERERHETPIPSSKTMGQSLSRFPSHQICCGITAMEAVPWRVPAPAWKASRRQLLHQTSQETTRKRRKRSQVCLVDCSRAKGRTSETRTRLMKTAISKSCQANWPDNRHRLIPTRAPLLSVLISRRLQNPSSEESCRSLRWEELRSLL